MAEKVDSWLSTPHVREVFCGPVGSVQSKYPEVLCSSTGSGGKEIKSCLMKFVEFHNLQAAFILTCVGSIQKAKIRLANSTATNTNDVR